MAAVVIPFDREENEVYFEQVTNLDGVDFRLIFSYNAQDTFWYISIRNEDDSTIQGCEGIRLVNGGYPIRRVTDLDRPLGELAILTEQKEEPTLDSFDSSHTLMYIPIADIEALL